MKTRSCVPVSFVVLFFGALALVIASASALRASAQEALPAGTYAVEAPTFQVGDFWKYRYLNKKGGFAQTVTEVSDKGMILTSQAGTKTAYSQDGNMVSGYGTLTGKAVTYDPPIPRLQFPLWVGKRWTVSFTARSNGWSERFTLGGKVVSREKIALPAGAFDALKLELRFSTGNQELCWYAESVKRFVKCEYTDPGRSYELETFRLEPLLGPERTK